MTDAPSSSAPTIARDRAGFRLHRLELYNWGTFHERVWSLEPGGDSALVTGDIGSGKSTLVDALTTLLVPPGKAAYNKAAGAEARERTVRSYVLGHYKSARADHGSASKAVALRDMNSYSVVLARFESADLGQHVTLAQVFWMSSLDGQPSRLFVVSDEPLSIAEHFANFGTEIKHLKKRLRKLPKTEFSGTFPPYAAGFRRKLGIDSPHALELFHQTVSMKSVGNLTDFVREHMLEPFPVDERIAALIGHFDDLNRAHEAVLKAKTQVERLTPLVADCDRHGTLATERGLLKADRDALSPWFALLKGELLEKRRRKLDQDLERLTAKVDTCEGRQRDQRAQFDQLKRDIAKNGGDRIEQIKAERARWEQEKSQRAGRAEQYAGFARQVGVETPMDDEAFAANRRHAQERLDAIKNDQATVQNDLTDASVELRELRNDHGELTRELESLKTRRSNIPARMLALRDSLATALGLEPEALPFAGELLQVRETEKAWQGAIERVLHGFGLSLLVGDDLYPRVAEWVDRTHLGGRLVYYRVRDAQAAGPPRVGPSSLVRKLQIKPDSEFYGWLEAETARRFDLACCESLDEFRRETRALTRSGQIKGTGERHEKDDRHRVDDPSRFVLGWSNEAKIAALEGQARDLETRIQAAALRFSELQDHQARLGDDRSALEQLLVFQTFRDLDWKPLVLEIERLGEDLRRLEQESDILATLGRQLAELETALGETEKELQALRDDQSRRRVLHEQTEQALTQAGAILDSCPASTRAIHFPRLEAHRPEALGEHTLTVESCDNREKDFREYLQAKIDAEDKRLDRLAEKIVRAMEAYRKDYPLETAEADASVGAAGEYRSMLERLTTDDLPRFEERFKELLNENTIREVANFQSQLGRERQSIKERIEIINESLRGIDYNPGRYIVLEPSPTPDADVRDFQQDLRACTEGALTGSDDDAYSEAKFLQVRRIIERLRGREGSTDLDRRWTRKVTDVRNWFSFSASERWREDDTEHEHYADSGGKSGGQKEKLAYTVLAASLAYQFGLGGDPPRARSFRFVVIDEAFGRGSDESARYGLELFQKMRLQLLVVTPLQKIHIIEPYVSGVGFVHNEGGRASMLRNLTIEEYRAERAARTA